jgi:hypothetical protein
MLCSKCNEPATDFVTCRGGLCGGGYHYHCAGVAESTYRKMGQEKKSAWRCVLCRAATSPIRQPQTDAVAEIMREIKEFRADFASLRSDFVGIKDDLRAAVQNISDLKSKWSDLEVRVDGIDNRLVDVEGRISVLAAGQKQIADAQRTLDELRQENNLLNQYSRLNNIEIQGIPKKNGENLHSIFHDVCAKVGIAVLETDIDTIHRVQPYRRRDSGVDTSHSSIVVRFTQRQRKNQLMAAVRARRGLTTADIGMSGAASRIYINEHLTPANKLLLKRARELKTTLNYTYLWVRDCKIFLRKNEKSRVIKITSDSDLSNLQ